jgi:hypothetical protein
MEKQYYTPKIEEFHPTFRYESCIPFREIGDESWKENWIKHEYSLLDFEWTIHTILTQLQFDNAIRVKSLDHSDIIEAGWELIEDGKHIVEFMIKGSNEDTNIYLTYRTESEFVEIHNNGDNREDYVVYFQGTVKNYNKLLDVMEMLEIRN